MELKYIVSNNKYKNINEIITSYFRISTKLKNKLIRQKNIYLNGKFVDTRIDLKIGDEIIIDFNYFEDNSNIIPTKMSLEIVYEDDWLLVINKPAGITIHPSILHFNDSLSNGIRYYFDEINFKKKIRPINRLDKDTSGLVLFAKCEYIQEILNTSKDIKKEYLCLCSGIFKEKSGTINKPIARKNGSIIERCIDKNGKKAITHYKVLKEFNTYSLVSCLLETGRTHQIRVHMASISHPLLGDSLYSLPSSLISRQALHCYKIEFTHPITKNRFELTASIPKDFKCLC